jgi:O-antigen/teichoic acid export membrane protein
MGIIQKQGIQSSLLIMLGFVIGAVNLLVLFPLFFTKTEMGLVRALIDTGATLSLFCTLGTLPVVYKFYPFYNQYLGKFKNDLPILTLTVNLIGFGILLLLGWQQKDFIIRKLGKSPSFAANFSYVYPYTFFLLMFYWLESFAWGLRKGVYTNFLRETAVRILTTLLILAFGFGLISLQNFILFFSLIYVIPTLLLLYSLVQSGEWSLNKFKLSHVTRRLGKKMLNFSLFVFAGQFFNMLAKTNDTFLIFGLRGLSDTGIFAIATYVSAILEIPQRSLNSISIPVLAVSWKNKDFANIKHIYHKSVSNLLAIGLLAFGLIWLNIENLVAFLNWISNKESGGYDQLTQLIFIMGLAKLIDLATGVNAQIIGTSNYWKFDFYTNLIYIILSLPMNFILIKYYGLEGLAYSNLVALVIYNSMRFTFLYKKFQLQPYTWKHALFLGLSLLLMIGIFYVPHPRNFIWNILMRSSLYTACFAALFFWIKPAPDVEDLILKFCQKNLPALFQKR